MADGPAFNVLFVCTGNICRSAFAEVLCRQLFVDRMGPGSLRSFVFSSAGLQAVVGAGMHPYTQEALALWGPQLFEAGFAFVARPLRPHMVRWADLILTADDQHRAEIGWSAPEATNRLFTMRRFGRIVASLDPDELPYDPDELPYDPVPRARAVVVAAADSSEPLRDAADSVPDPNGRPPEYHLKSADLIVEAVASFVDLVAPVTGDE